MAFTVTGQPGFVLDDDTDPVRPDRVTLGGMAAGTYTIAQAAVDGATLGALVCDGGDARTDLPARATTLTVAPGDQVTCTFTNAPFVPPTGATITVVLDAHDRQDFDVSVSGRGVITLDDDNDPQRANSARVADLAPGSYVVTQSPVPGWRLAALTCPGASVVDQAGATATVTLGAGDQVVCTFTMAPDRPLSGAIRWDAWHDGPAGRAVEHTLGPAHWHDRLPWFSEITGPGTVRTRADNQAAADREIEIADELGLDYFAFIVYDTDREVGSEDEGMMRGLKLYRQSALRDRVKYTVVIDGQRLAMPAERAAVLRYMQDPNWVYVDGRPLVYVGLYSRPVAADVATLRAESLAQGTGDPYVVYMTLGADSPTTGATYAAANGIDAVSSYIMGVATSDGRPYADLATGARRTWDQVSGRGVAVVPTVMSGWDPRPRVERPPYWGGSGRNWYQAPTPSELATHLGEALDWARSRRSPAVVAYAWNEFDEGGWLAPTLRADDARQDGIRAALTAGTVPTLPRVSVDDASALEGTGTSGAAPATLSFPVTLSVPAATPVTVAYAFTPGSALPGDDYVDEPGSVTFAPGQTVASIPLRVVGDAISDGDESVGVRLGRSVGAVVDRGRATGTLVDDDAPPRPAETFVSDLGWVSARNGFGPVERDRSNGQGGVGDGGKITVNGVVYDKGLGVHASSTVVFALRPGDARFVADVGVDDACGRSGTVVFRVLVDGVVRFQTARLTNQSATVPVSVDVAGGRQLTLQVTDGGDGAACDHADWAAARLLATRR
ncbi:MAG: NPCBM/NEW2 domain-containing protein [Actinomycetota bacterium]